MFNIACIIMASGLSRRMEQNKLLLSFSSKKLFEYVVDAVNKSDIKQKILVSSYEEIFDYTKKLDDFILVKNENNSLGQSNSIKLGVSSANSCDGFMFLPCDMPFIKYDLLNDICSFFYENKNSIVVPRVKGKNSMPTIFPYSFKNELLSIKGDMGGRDIIKNNVDIVRYLETKNPLFLQDIDTKEDLKYLKIFS